MKIIHLFKSRYWQLLFVIIFAFTFSCSQEDTIKNEINNNEFLKIETISHHRLKQKERNILDKLVNKNSNILGRENTTNYFEVDSTSITHITYNENYESYTFFVTSNDDAHLVQNILISNNPNGITDVYLINYTLDTSINNVNTDEINQHILEKSVTKILEPEINYQGRTEMCLSVTTYTELLCDDSSGRTIRDNGQLGNGCSSNWRQITVTSVSLMPCGGPSGGYGSNSGTSGDGGAGSDGGSTSNPGGTGGTGGTTGGGNQEPNDPDNNNSDPQEPCIAFDSNGNCITALTDPNVQESNNDKKNCIELNKLSQPSNQQYPNQYIAGDNKSIRDALLNMDNEIVPGWENGYGLMNIGDFRQPPNGHGPTAVDVPPQSYGSVKFKKSVQLFGTIHTHPNDGITNPMFSAGDIFSLSVIKNNYISPFLNQYNPNGDALFVSILAVKINGEVKTYALKIDNSAKFQTLVNIISNKTKKKKFERKLKGVYDDMRKGLNPDLSEQEYEKVFLKFITNFGGQGYDLGLSLFKMETANIINDFGIPTTQIKWKKLKLTENGNSVEATEPCK